MGVVVFAPNWLGDSILSRRAVATLLAAHASRASVVAHPRVAEVWKAWPGLDVVETSPGPWLSDARVTARRLRARGPFEHGYLLSASFRSALILTLAGVPRRVGFAGGGRSFLLTDPVSRLPAGRMHYGREFFHLLPPSWEPRTPPPFAWPDTAAREATALLTSHGLANRDYVVIAPGTAGSAKRYSTASWRRVATRVAARFPVALVGTAAEARWAEEAAGPDVTNLCGRTSQAVLANVLSRAAAFAGADSGAAHLAAEVGCPTLALFGPGDPVETRPVGEHVTTLSAHLWCSPCRSRTCLRPEAPSECMERIPPEQVAEALLRLCETPRP